MLWPEVQTVPSQVAAAAPYRGEARGWPSPEEREAAATVVSLIDQSRFALEMACGLSSQLEVIPATERLPGLHRLHEQGFIPMSDHALTAAGAARTMLETGPTLPLLVLVVGCMQQTLELGQVNPGSLHQMSVVVTEPYTDAFAASTWWSVRILPPLVQALTIVQERLGTQGWQEVTRERQRVEEAIHRARAGLPREADHHQAEESASPDAREY